MIKLVLFDIDGTLIQTGGAGERAFARVCELEFGIPEGTAHLQFAGRTDPSRCWCSSAFGSGRRASTEITGP